ncbi:hypothetical protein Golax_025739 [Gossypium laxum]|uniref:Uncharacterized protein n=1 Tax=Gossypium laxum TaxID=34288 RepID=A0A7J9B5K7_9ROSI|nr:hypothetical protein [Gossypium laxum]
MRNCKGIWENAIEKEWNKLCLPSEELIIIPIVQEFYLALKQREATRPFYGIRSIVKVRGINVLVTEIGVPIERVDETMSPPRKLLRDDILK